MAYIPLTPRIHVIKEDFTFNPLPGEATPQFFNMFKVTGGKVKVYDVVLFNKTVTTYPDSTNGGILLGIGIYDGTNISITALQNVVRVFASGGINIGVGHTIVFATLNTNPLLFAPGGTPSDVVTDNAYPNQVPVDDAPVVMSVSLGSSVVRPAASIDNFISIMVPSTTGTVGLDATYDVHLYYDKIDSDAEIVAV